MRKIIDREGESKCQRLWENGIITRWKWQNEEAKNKTWKLPKTIFICFRCFFPKASHYSNPKHFVWFRHFNSNHYSCLVNDLVAGVTNPQLTQSVKTQNYCLSLYLLCGHALQSSRDKAFCNTCNSLHFGHWFPSRTSMCSESLLGWVNRMSFQDRLHILLLLSFG